MKKTAMATLKDENVRILNEIKKMGFLAVKHPDPAVRKEAAGNASKLMKLLAALGVTGAGMTGGLMAAEKPADPMASAPDDSPMPGAIQGFAGGAPAPAVAPEPFVPYEMSDFDTILGDLGLEDYAGELNNMPAPAPVRSRANAPAVSSADFDLGPSDTSDYDRNRMNVEMLLGELQGIDDRMGSYTLPAEEVNDLNAKREALMKRLEETGFSEADDYYR